jgi:hypothetical protein
MCDVVAAKLKNNDVREEDWWQHGRLFTIKKRLDSKVFRNEYV